MSATGAGGVRNIRAMFEAKNETSSPPSRGRSPAGGSESVRSTSSRPISKVRASFVAVEKSGQMGPMLGLRRVSDVDHTTQGSKLDGPPDGRSHDSRLSFGRAESNAGSVRQAIEEEPSDSETGVQIDNKSGGEELAVKTPKKDQKSTANLGSQTLDGQRDDGTTSSVKPNGIATPSKETEVVESKGKEAEQKDGTRKAPQGKPLASKSQGQATKTATATAAKRQSTAPKSLPDRAKAVPPGTSSTTSSQVKLNNKPSTASIRSTTSATSKVKPNPSSSSTVKTPTTSQPKLSNIKTDNMPKASSKTSTPRTSLALTASKEISKTTKSRPKSPTKPQKLPSSATAPTTSSAAKTTSERRPSNEAAKSKPGTDNDFLARMMRPTASSASKTHDKVTAATPPRKGEGLRPKRKSEGQEIKSLEQKTSSPKPKTTSSKAFTPTKAEPSTPAKVDSKEASTDPVQPSHIEASELDTDVEAAHTGPADVGRESTMLIKEKQDEHADLQDHTPAATEEQSSMTPHSMDVDRDAQPKEPIDTSENAEPTTPISVDEPNESVRSAHAENITISDGTLSTSGTVASKPVPEALKTEASPTQKQEDPRGEPHQASAAEARSPIEPDKEVKEETFDPVAPTQISTTAKMTEPEALHGVDESTEDKQHEDVTIEAVGAQDSKDIDKQIAGAPENTTEGTARMTETATSEQPADT